MPSRASSRQGVSRDPEGFAFDFHPVYPFILKILILLFTLEIFPYLYYDRHNHEAIYFISSV